MGVPPWAEATRYGDDSAIFRAGRVKTPVMLVQGDFDFIPIQQSEEFFTALYRHVLDLWSRISDWLEETNASRRTAR